MERLSDIGHHFQSVSPRLSTRNESALEMTTPRTHSLENATDVGDDSPESELEDPKIEENGSVAYGVVHIEDRALLQCLERAKEQLFSTLGEHEILMPMIVSKRRVYICSISFVSFQSFN